MRTGTKTGRFALSQPEMQEITPTPRRRVPVPSTDFSALELRALAHMHADMTTALGGDLTAWVGRCHEASLTLVRKFDWRTFGARARVARGYHPDVRSQHSWVVIGADAYAERALIVDPTLWAYDLVRTPHIYIASARMAKHYPKGKGIIWLHSKPQAHGGRTVYLRAHNTLSEDARAFLQLLGPLDIRGWHELANCPVEGWPAREIFTAMEADPVLKRLVPVDVLGMLTELNPGGLYF